MGVSMSPRYYDPIIVPRYNYYYPPPGRVILVNHPPPGMVPIQPRLIPINGGAQRIILSPSPMVIGPHGPNTVVIGPNGPIPKKAKKRTIDNLKELFGEQPLTKEMLEKGEQKNCSICLDDFVVGDKIIYLPCFHYYHAKCIEKWTKTSDKCPLCNIEISIQE